MSVTNSFQKAVLILDTPFSPQLNMFVKSKLLPAGSPQDPQLQEEGVAAVGKRCPGCTDINLFPLLRK